MTLERLIAELPRDTWRDAHEHSPDLAAVHARMARGEGEEALSEWLATRQICQFARVSARAGLLRCRVIGEGDVARGDDFVAAILAEARRDWLRSAFDGEAAGLVVLLASPRVTTAAPSPELAMLARRFAALYCGRGVALDEVVLDEVYLARDAETAWRWTAPLNFFAAQADGRWWEARRIPGGIALSINAVGHLVTAGMLPESGEGRALRHAVATIERATAFHAHGDVYTAPFDTDVMLPSAFFTDDAPAPESQVLRRFTSEFSCGGRGAVTADEWSEADARQCGCGEVVARRDVWR